MNRKKYFLVEVLSVLLPFMMSAKINCLWDMGHASVSVTFNNQECALCPMLEIPEIYFAGERTGIFASICPFSIHFKYSPQDYEYDGHREDWSIDTVSFSNIALGWLHHLNDDFLLEFSARINAVNVMDIQRVCISPSAEISWTPGFLENLVGTSKIQFMPKAVSLRAGAAFDSKYNFAPGFFVSFGVDFVLLAEFAGIFM